MTDAPLPFCFGVHNHQPIGNFEGVLRETTEQAYQPFLQRLQARPEVRMTVHCTGSLLEWLREHAAPTFELLGRLAADGRIELLTGGFYEPILAILPDSDKRGQIERLTDFLKSEFGVRPRGMWLAERVWEPQLPRALREAGVEYVVVDDRHFALAGLEPDDLGGYYLTEDQGATVGVFPINQRLRHLVPFAAVDTSLEYLESQRGRLPAVAVLDDGEKFGGWPGTHRLAYEEGWLDRFFDRLLAAEWLRLSTLGDVVDSQPAAGRVYLPTASYIEMGEWALPEEASRRLEEVKRELAPLEGSDRYLGLLRGGFWRNFLVKYPEVSDVYWKMLRLSAALEHSRRRHPDDRRLLDARESLWRGQANDAYWHGVFGGCYLPHLRRAVKSALLDAEVRLTAVDAEPVAVTDADVNGDGRREILVRTSLLAVTVNPERGATLTEIAALGRRHDLADVLGRRPEAYHARIGAGSGGEGGTRSIHDVAPEKEPGLAARLVYDRFRRASLLDGLFATDGELDAVEPWPASRVALGDARFEGGVERHGDVVDIALHHRSDGAMPTHVDKRLTVRDASVEARYRVRGAGGRWAVQWNLALSAGDAPGRYLRLPGQPSLGSSGRLAGIGEIALVDEWLGLEAHLVIRPAAELAWGPVETVSVSEGGFERIYQGTALLLTWRLDGEAGELATTLTVVER